MALQGGDFFHLGLFAQERGGSWQAFTRNVFSEAGAAGTWEDMGVTCHGGSGPFLRGSAFLLLRQ